MKANIKLFFSGIKDFFKTADILLLGLCVLASGIGLVLIYSATRSYETESYMVVQVTAMIIGIIFFVVFSIVDIDIISQKWPFLILFNAVLIVMLLIWGVEGGTGNKSWLRFGPIGIQPSEIIKITFIVVLGKQMSYLHESRRGISSPVSVIQLLVHVLIMFGCIIVTSSDLGSALVFIVIFVIMCFSSGLKLIWFFLAALAGALVAPYVWNNLLQQYQRERIMAPYFPETVDPDGLGITWHANQSKMALASGGFAGQGYMNGTQSQTEALPFKHTDFIFSVAGEEFGMIGCIVITVLLLAIIIRCLYVGFHSHNYMNTVICCGIAAMIGFQTFENIGMCLGLTPVVGLTLPFMSYGGSSIVSCFAAMGIVSGIRIRPNPMLRRRY